VTAWIDRQVEQLRSAANVAAGDEAVASAKME
jgi:hypothetical protein